MRYVSTLMFLALISTYLSAQETGAGTQIQSLPSFDSGQPLLKQPGLGIKSLPGKKPCLNCLPPGDAPPIDLPPIYADKNAAQINNNLLRNQTAAILSLKQSIDALEKRVSTLEKGAH